MAAPRRVGKHSAQVLARGLILLGLLLVAAMVAFPLLDPGGVADSMSGGVLDPFLLALPGVSFFLVGAVLAVRCPENSVGWLCLTIGLLWLLLGAQNAAAIWAVHSGHIELGAWLGSGLSNWWVPAVGLTGTHLPLRLPDGSLPSRRWRWYSRFCTVVIVFTYLLVATEPTVADIPGTENPVTTTWLQSFWPLFVLFPLSLLGAIASLVLRYRRASGAQRLQLRWIALGGGIFVLVYVVGLVIRLGFLSEESGLADTLLEAMTFLAFTAIPVAIAVAILRYRLYDIDVVINRTLVYGTLTAILAAAYLGLVLVLQLVLSPLTERSDLAVAGSTLAVAGLFRPARARIQAFVNRRFYRNRYDAGRTLAAYTLRLRQQLDLQAISDDLADVVQETVQPKHFSVWLRHQQPAVTIPGRGPGRQNLKEGR